MPRASPSDMTTPKPDSLTTEGFVNKRNAVEHFNRSHRSLSRDITTAVRLGDEEILKHFRLQTQDGQVREGTGVTIDVLDELRDAGQVPTWWAERNYLLQRYGLRGEESSAASEKNNSTSAGSARPQSTEQPFADTDSGYTKPQLPIDPELRAIVLEHLHYAKEQHDRDTKELTNRILQVVETNQQLQGQTNTLFNEFQEALKKGGGLRNLIAGSVTHPGSVAAPSPHSSKSQPVSNAKIVNVDAKNHSSQQSRKRQSPSHSKAITKKSNPAKKKRPAKPTKKKIPKATIKPPTFAERHLPNFSRLFGSTSSKNR